MFVFENKVSPPRCTCICKHKHGREGSDENRGKFSVAQAFTLGLQTISHYLHTTKQPHTSAGQPKTMSKGGHKRETAKYVDINVHLTGRACS